MVEPRDALGTKTIWELTDWERNGDMARSKKIGRLTLAWWEVDKASRQSFLEI